MRHSKYLLNGLIGATALLVVGSRFVPGTDEPGPVVHRAVTFVTGEVARIDTAVPDSAVPASVSNVQVALGALGSAVRQLSHPRALEDAFRSYFAYKTAHPDVVRKPYLYFVDYGLPSTTPRGYVFDMAKLSVIEGPFMVAHGRGSSTAGSGVPTRFSNASGSSATSLGLYLAQETYAFSGKMGRQSYGSIGLRLMGLSGRFNDNARARGVVAHGAPYVAANRAGRSQGCPAVEPSRARRLLPKLANGGLVFLFAPDSKWMASDPWLTASAG